MGKIERLVNILKIDAKHKSKIEYVKILSSKKPSYGRLQKQLDKKIQSYLTFKGIKLYTHQSAAIDALRNGENVVITTPTASGKTLAFNIPILETLNEKKYSTALYIYPTKALSNDQLKIINEFIDSTAVSLQVNIYDGDTPKGIRPRIRETSRIIISNPYEIHHILPWHFKWQKFLSNLSYIVIDEAHKYRGVFGSNVAFLIRRLKRICAYYGSDPQFILSTATLANPSDFAEKLTGCKFKIISKDGAPKGKKYFIFYNPFKKHKGRSSAHMDTTELFTFFVKNNLQTLCFTISRKLAELIAYWAKRELKKLGTDLHNKISPYRAGYLPEQRREIENNLKNGVLRGITSTNALELGIDIGSLDSVIISGYPGTVMSTWQQAGRAGRGIDESVVTLLAFENPLDQYFMKHPEAFFGRPHEHAIVDLSNPYITSGHILCGASEYPIKIHNDEEFFGDNLKEILAILGDQDLLDDTPNGWVYRGKARATQAISLHNITRDIFKVVRNGNIIETLDRAQAYREAHKGAVLYNQGETYVVIDLDLKSRIVEVVKKDVDYHTEALKDVQVSILEEIERKQIGGLELTYGDLEVREQYDRYNLIRFDRVLGTELIDLPRLDFKSIGLWFTVPETLEETIWGKRKKDKDIKEQLKERSEKELRRELFAGGLHGVEHSMIAITPFHVMCDRWDIGGVSTQYHPDTLKPTIFLYDGFEGGIGLSEKAYELIQKILKITYDLVKDCECKDGCPSCIYSPKCGNENRPLDKKSTQIILKELLDMTAIKRTKP